MTVASSTPAALDTLPGFVRTLPNVVVYSDEPMMTTGMRRTICTTKIGRDAPRIEVLTSRNGGPAGAFYIYSDNAPVLAEAIIRAFTAGHGTGVSGHVTLAGGGSMIIGFRRRPNGAGSVTVQRIEHDGTEHKTTALQGAELFALERAADAIIEHIATNPPRHP